ncbi:MAG TPA: pseudouridine synthase [Candidatus Saccharicenans sp.]|nr:pseudouridine synthase [Candidatus Saccharicenans sp.]
MNKFLAQAGVASRREADRLVEEGRVKINRRVVKRPGTLVDEISDRVEVDGRPVNLPPSRIYLLLNKPSGYIVTMNDPQKRKTAAELLPPLPLRLFPVGRLDRESEGVLLFTNDGELANRLLHPRYGFKKIYEVKVKGYVTDQQIDKLKRGIFIDGRKTTPDKVGLIYRNRQFSYLRLEIHEGRKHEVRKMFYALDLDVKKLKRVAMAGLTIKGLRPGFWRYLKKEEVIRLKKQAGLLD